MEATKLKKIKQVYHFGPGYLREWCLLFTSEFRAWSDVKLGRQGQFC